MSILLKSNSPLIMGVLNVTPDSFYDGGKYNDLDHALKQAESMVAEGVDIIDIGGESTRPGARAISVEEEMHRVLPVLERLTQEMGVPISVDTRHTQVMQKALDKGASMINDVMALQGDGAVACVASSTAAVCIMHMQGQPGTMQDNPTYQDVIDEVFQFLEQRIQVCEQKGITRDRIYVDPGFGFGKTLTHNLQLLGGLSRFKALGCPILVGLSRKSMFGKLLNAEPQDRLFGSLAGALLSVVQGADIVRTHDVKATKDVVEVFKAVQPFWQNLESIQGAGQKPGEGAYA